MSAPPRVASHPSRPLCLCSACLWHTRICVPVQQLLQRLLCRSIYCICPLRKSSRHPPGCPSRMHHARCNTPIHRSMPEAAQWKQVEAWGQGTAKLMPCRSLPAAAAAPAEGGLFRAARTPSRHRHRHAARLAAAPRAAGSGERSPARGWGGGLGSGSRYGARGPHTPAGQHSPRHGWSTGERQEARRRVAAASRRPAALHACGAGGRLPICLQPGAPRGS